MFLVAFKPFSSLRFLLVRSKYRLCCDTTFNMATAKEGNPIAVPEDDMKREKDVDSEKEHTERMVTEDGRRELIEADAWDKLGYSFPTWRKW